MNREVVTVEQGRHLNIICSSSGKFSGTVEWKRLNGPGKSKFSLEIPVEEKCEERGLLVQSHTDNSTSVLKTGIFGIDISADGIYECTANNTIEVSHIKVGVNVPSMYTMLCTSTLSCKIPLNTEFSSGEKLNYIRFSVSDLEALLTSPIPILLNLCPNTSTDLFFDYLNIVV